MNSKVTNYQLLFFLLFITFPLVSFASPLQQKTTNMNLLVTDTDGAIAKIVEAAEKQGGYFTFRSQNRLNLKVPARNSDSILSLIQNLGETTGHDMQSSDFKERLLDLKSQLKANQESYADYIKVINQAKEREDVLALQTEINQLILEIERIKGQIKNYQHKSKYAEINLNLNRFTANTTLNKKALSDFRWINNVNANNLLKDYQ